MIEIKSNKIICKILRYLDLNINRKVTIEELSNNFYYDRFYIMKLFKEELGITIIDYINKIRVYNSLKEIEKPITLTKLYLDNGFYSLEYFSETFRKYIGVSPRTYLKYKRNRFLIDFKFKDKIINNVISLQMLIEKKEEYFDNEKPGKSIKNITTIFKNN